MSSIHNIDVTTIDGKTIKLGDYAGKTLLIVNVASECGLTHQYEQLEAFYEANKDKGLEILGFPSNEFGGQEPGTEAEIHEFCRSKFGVKFPMFSKINVNGDERHPLYQQLLGAMPDRSCSPESGFLDKLRGYGKVINDGDIAWNFEKFLVNGEGQVVGHYTPDTSVTEPLLANAIAEQLKA